MREVEWLTPAHGGLQPHAIPATAVNRHDGHNQNTKATSVCGIEGLFMLNYLSPGINCLRCRAVLVEELAA